MKKFIVVWILALVAGVGLALELPEQSAVVITDAGGSIVGFGAFQDGALEISLSEEASGFLTLTFTSGSGEVLTLEVMVAQDGTVVVTQSMAELAAEVEGSVEVTHSTAADVDAAVAEGLVIAAEAAGEHGAQGRAVAEAAIASAGPPDVSERPAREAAEEDTEDEESEPSDAAAGAGAGVAGQVVGEVGVELPAVPSRP